MDEYTLYLDESFTYKSGGKDPAFAIGGFIIKDSDVSKVDTEIDKLKTMIWSDLANPTNVVLHELDIKDALESRINKNNLKSEYVRFRNNKKLSTKVYKELSKIIKNTDLYTLGCVIKIDDFNNNFPKGIGNEISLVCMQIILENYTHFLFKNNATGKIVYESRDAQDKTMLMKFYQVSSIGTMYVRPDAIQQKITQFCFIKKNENIQCLQLADFIPNLMARKKSGKFIHKDTIDLTKNILIKSYDGTTGNTSRYGIKIIPRIT